MGKKKAKGEYNDFLDGEKLRDNTEVWRSMQGSATMSSHSQFQSRDVDRDFSSQMQTKGRGKGKHGKGNGKGVGSTKPRLTHFLCLPLVNQGSEPQLESALGRFKEDLEGLGKADGVEGVPAKAVRPVRTLHLTLGVMSLDEAGLEDMGRCLEDLDLRGLVRHAGALASAEQRQQLPSLDTNTATSTLSINLQGLIPMHQPHKTSILYAEPTESTTRLYPFASALRDHFMKKGFLVEDNRALKLHATIVNTIYAKPGGRRQGRGKLKLSTEEKGEIGEMMSKGEVEEQNEGDRPSTTSLTQEPTTAEPKATTSTAAQDGSSGHGPNAKSSLRFDATRLIERYKEFMWAENVRVDRVQICKMVAKKILGDDGEVLSEEYECVFEKGI